MDARARLLEYARQYNNQVSLTDEEFVGKMVIDGVVINRTPNSSTVARASREGRTIIVTETIEHTTREIVDGKAETKVIEETSEIFRVDI